MKEVGGAASFCCRREELRFGLGATTGASVEETAILSRRLCPGTPSKVKFCPFAAGGFGVARGFSGNLTPCLRAADLVMRGAITGGAVDATAITDDRLWPGTSMNAWILASLV